MLMGWIALKVLIMIREEPVSKRELITRKFVLVSWFSTFGHYYSINTFGARKFLLFFILWTNSLFAWADLAG
jgi:hypothetical protein